MADIYEKQVLTDSAVPMKGVDLDTSAGKELEQAGAAIKKISRQVYAGAMRNDMARQLNEVAAQYADDPQSMDAAMQEIRNGIMSDISDPATAGALLVEYDLSAGRHLASARENFVKGQRAEQKSMLNDMVAENVDEITRSAIDIFSSDNPEFIVGFSYSRELANAALGAVDDRKRNVFTDAQRRSGEKSISNGALVGLQNFLTDPTADPERTKEIINRFNAGKYKDMFSAEDYPRAMRLIKAAAKQIDSAAGSGSSKDSDETLQYIMFDNQLAEFKEKSNDKALSKAGMNDMIGFRMEAANAFETGKITDKEYKKLMSATAAPTLEKIRAHGEEGDGWFLSTPPMKQGIKKITAQIANMDLPVDQQLYIYESFLQDYAAAGGTDERSEENRNTADVVAQNVITKFLTRKYPTWDPKTASAIVMGRSVYKTPGSTTTPTNAKMYRIMEIGE